ncbi:MAG TPA: preprotein translocase subunit YajC [Gammaproteobacteria bacterium]|nr:preprotein translocase subunit YajC [Gammaproteobacteria bacterium]
MNILNLFGISDALAQATTTTATTTATPAHSTQGSLLSLLPTLVIFILVFYFLLIRPQAKRAKEHRKLIDGLGKDDEVVTTGGLAGKIIEINDNFLILQVAKDVQVTFQKGAIAAVLPKGTLKSV